MTLHQQLGTVLAACVFLCLSACQSGNQGGIGGGGKGGGGGTAATHTITFIAPASPLAGCKQQLDYKQGDPPHPGPALIDVNWGDTITFNAVDANGNGGHYSLTFVAASVGCASPFMGSGTCQTSFGDTAASSGQTGGESFNYGSLSITTGAGTTTCDLSAGPMGMRIRP